jgi:hypothetical protein
MSTPSGPNPITTAWTIWRARRVRRPAPHGEGRVDHSPLQPLLDALQRRGVPGLEDSRTALIDYRDLMATVDPDSLGERESMAFWLNVYNAGAIDLAAEAQRRAEDSVLRIPGGFDEPWITVNGETLTLTEIEHGKLRRFNDPRIHGALVCGSASCPTLRYETYRGHDLDAQLDDQMQRFLTEGGATADRDANTLNLSRVFLWYGGDFVRPHRMPTWLPPRKSRLVAHLSPWLQAEQVDWIHSSAPRITFQSYDWSLACAVR